MSTPIRIPRYQFRRRAMAIFTRGLLHTLTQFNVNGREHIPESGPFIAIANHFNFADPAMMVYLFQHHVEFIAGSVRPNAPTITTRIPELWITLNVKRGTGATKAIKEATMVLDQGGIVGVFPEAGAWAQVLRPARPGTALIAAKTKAKILPIGIDGAPDIFPSLGKMKRAKVTVNVGKPFGPFNLTGSGRERRKELENIGEEMMLRIADLIPPHKRGVYSDDPNIRAEAEKVADFPF